MKIAVACEKPTRITAHTGKCRNFWIYTVSAEDILQRSPLQLSPQQTFHASSPQLPHPLDGVQVLICGSVGQGLLRRLRNGGIEVVVTQEADADAAVHAYLQGSLVQEDAENFRQHLHHSSAEAAAGVCGGAPA